VTTARAVDVALVHGGFVDGAGWDGVYKILRKDGYAVSVVQNPTLSLAGDVAATKLVLAAQDRPVILVGHSYGGVVITEAGTDPKVAGLVYIRGVRTGSGRVGRLAHQGSAARRPGAADSAPAAGLSVPRQGEVPRVLRGRRGRRPRGVHGGLAGSMGRRGPQRGGEHASVEDQAQLVPRGHRRPDDPAIGPTRHVQACRIDRRRGAGQSCNLRVTTTSGGRPDCESGQECEPCRALDG
jgi:pimeloyl-ACP methyl ester carboxylesterase